MIHPDLLSTPPSSDPARLLHYRDRQYAAEWLAAALLHLDVFNWLHRNPESISETICDALGLTSRPLDVLLTLCRANGLLETDPAGRHRLSRVGEEFLVADSPWYLGPYYHPIRETPIVRGCVQVLRTGRPANWQAQSDGKDWHASMESEEFARAFTELMNCRGLALSQALASALAPRLSGHPRLLDVGGGSGIYSAALVAAQPLLRAVVLEQSPVDRIARQQIERWQLADRISVVTGDMFVIPWPTADVVLLSNVLHDWDLPEVRRILTCAAGAIPRDGIVVIHDAFLDDAKAGPLPVAEYSTLLANITQGRCYSSAEFSEILRSVGFEPETVRPTLADRGFLTARKV